MGTIPSIEHPTKWTSIDFSNNRLEGKIPESLSKVNESSFYGNPGLCGEKLHKACDEAVAPPIPSQPEDVEESKKAAAELMTVAAVIFVFMVAAILVLKRRQKKFDVLESQVFEEPVEVRVSGPRRKETAELVVVNEEKGIFGMTDLMKAAAEALGNGSMGSSYKAVMSNGLAVAVKRMKEMNVMGREEFDAEMRRLGRLRHQNVLTPLAYHHRIDEKLLVHEYIPKGSLLYLLHGDRGPANAELDWPVRLKIIHGITRGLDYLHTELASLDVPHGNLKSSNILLCTNYEPLLVDYGLNQMLSTAQATQVLFSYKSPEAMKSNQVSPKCDVYCLGIVILELLSGKFPSQYLIHGKGGIDVVQWAASAISEGREAEFFDPEIASSRESSSGMKQLLQVGVACTESDPERRLGMSEAIQRIGEIQIEGGTEARTCQLPSLRDGFPDLPGSQSRRQSLQEQQNDLSGRRSGLSSFADQSSRRTGDDFAFAIS